MNEMLNTIEDIDPKFLYYIAHKSKYTLLVWWYNIASGEFRKSNDSGIAHSNIKYFGDVYGKTGWVRGRVFNYGGDVYLIIYSARQLGIAKQSMVDILDKANNSVSSPIKYIIDEDGKDITSLFEAVHINRYGISKLGGA